MIRRDSLSHSLPAIREVAVRLNILMMSVILIVSKVVFFRDQL